MSSFVAGGKVSEINPDSVGVNPAWRKAMIHATFGVTWPEGTSFREIEDMVSGVRQGEHQLRELTPDSGAYFNEVHFTRQHRSLSDH